MPSLLQSRPNRPAAIILLILLAAALAQLLAFWPGIMVWDPIRQYRQAVSGQYDDWHPPAMNWLWRQLGLFDRGPAPMLLLEALLYWSGFALLALREALRGRTIRAAAIALLALLPASMVLLGTILKDVLMAGALLLATGLIAWRRPGDRALGLAAALLLVGAATLRFNAVPACLPLALLLLPERWTARPARLAVAATVAALILAAALPIANRLLGTQRSHVELSLIIYDLGGIARFSGSDAFPPMPIADPVAVNRGCYSPISWDPYAWWSPDPCPIGFTLLEPVLTAPGASATGIWARAIITHPFAYAAHRLVHFNQDVRFITHESRLPRLFFASDPNDWGFQVPPSRLREALAPIATASLATPLGWPICWLTLAGAVLLIGTGGNRLATALAWSSLLYGLSYLPLSVASEVRYHLWTMIAAGLAASIGISGSKDVARWRRIAACVLPGATIAIAIAARLAA
jgi:hypothetical protein